MKRIKMYSDELIDQESEIHYAFHKSLRDITVEHSHDFYEIFLVYSGKVKHTVNGVTETLIPGALVFIRPDDIHSYEKIQESRCEIINLAFFRRSVHKLFDYLGEGFDSAVFLDSKLPPSIILTEEKKEILKNKFEHLHLIHREEKGKIKTKLRMLLFDIFTKYFSDDITLEKSSVPSWLERIREEMQKKENFTKGFAHIQKLSNKSKEHFSREFKKHYKITVTDYINRLKLNYAANLLTNTDYSISHISFEAGFDNLSHFYHLFKKRFNSAPGDFRSKHGKTGIPV